MGNPNPSEVHSFHSCDSGVEPHRKACCCGLLTHRGCAFLVLICIACSAGCTFLGINTIGKRIAADGIQKASISFQSIDVGALNGTDTLHTRVVGLLTKPSPFDAKFYAASARIKVVGSNGELMDVGIVSLPDLSVAGGKDLELDINVTMQVDHPDAFGQAGRHFVSSSESPWSIEASVNVFCWAFGFVPIYLSGVPFSKSVTLEGMSGFSQTANPITMRTLKSTYGRQGVLEIGVEVNIFNPSYLSAWIIPQMQFNVSQRGKDFGVATLSSVHFKPGQNVVSAHFALHDNSHNRDAVEQFILGFLRAEIQPIAMLASKKSTEDPILQTIFDGLILAFDFQAPAYRFIQSIEASVDAHGLRAVASIFNPLPDQIVFGHMDMQINEGTMDGENIFDLNTKKSDTRIPGQILNPNSTSDLKIKLSLFNAHLTDPSQLIRLIGAARQGRVLVGVKGPVTITIAPRFQLTVQYSTNNVTCMLKCPIWCQHPHGQTSSGLEQTSHSIEMV